MLLNKQPLFTEYQKNCCFKNQYKVEYNLIIDDIDKNSDNDDIGKNVSVRSSNIKDY